MNKKLRKVGWVCSVFLMFMATLSISQVAEAQQYPTKPILLINPYDVGGTTDVLMRSVIAVATNYLEQRIVMEIKGGGGGAIGTDLVAKAAPDGYTLLCGGPGPNSILPAIEGRGKGPDDLDGVCQINYDSPLALVRADSPFKTLNDVIQYAKANPGKLVFGHTGIWGATDITWKMIKRQTGIVTRDVPHKGGGSTVLAVLGGEIDLTIGGYATAVPHLQAGKMRAIAYSGPERFSDLPGVPTNKEQGINVVFSFRRSVMAPKGTPRPIIDKLAGAFKKVAEDKSFIEMIKKAGQEVHYLGPDEFTKAWREEYEQYKELAKIYKK